MITIRDILKYFSLDVCAKLNIIEQYKERKKKEVYVPFPVKFICICSIFAICAFFISLSFMTGAVISSFSMKWFVFVGIAFLLVAYFMHNRQDFIYQYLTLCFLFLGFLTFSFGVDAWVEDGSLLFIALAAFLLLAVTYNIFDKEIYQFFATFFIFSLLGFYGYGQGGVIFQLLLAGILLIGIICAFIPTRFYNLYAVVKAIIIYLGITLFILYFATDFMDQSNLFHYIITGVIVLLGLVGVLNKDTKNDALKFGLIAVFFAIGALYSSYLVAFSVVIFLLGYLLSSIMMFVLGMVFYVVSLGFFYYYADVELSTKAVIALLMGFGYFGIAFLLRGKTYDQK